MRGIDPFRDSEQRARALEHARIFRQLLTVRLAAVALGTIGLAVLHVLPRSAGVVATLLWLIAVASARVAERRARTRFLQSPVIRFLQQTGNRPRAR